MWKNLARLFTSQACYTCDNELVGDEKYICLSCLSQIQETEFHLKPQDNELFFRLAGKVPLDGATSMFYFEKAGRFQKIMQALKYEGAPRLGFFLGAYMGKKLAGSDFFENVDAIVPVPLHKFKKIKRGFNQTEEIAKGLSKETGIPVRTDLIKRIKNTNAQASLTGVERWDNVKDAFSPQKISPERLLVLDDVITTGGTLEACIRALLSHDTPPKSIKIASIGFAKKS